MKKLHIDRKTGSSWSKGIILLFVLSIITGCPSNEINQIIVTPAYPDLTVAPASLSFAASGGQNTFSITSNTSWTVSRGNASWLTITPSSGSNSGTITVTATAHTDASQRTATITITGGGITRTISVTQDGATPAPTLAVSTKELSFTSAGGHKTFTISSNTSWTVSREAGTWLTVTPSSGSNNGTITVTAAENTSTSQRTVTITVTADSLTETVKVTQDEGAPPSTLTVSETVLSFTAASESKEFTITSNTSWTISSGTASWLAINPSSGSNDATITVTSSVNTSTSERAVTISVTGGGITQDIRVTQDGAPPTPTLGVGASELSFSSDTESKTFSITSNLNWTVSSDEEWVTVAPTSGANNGTITVTVEENTGFTQRTALITVEGGDITRIITVTQRVALAWSMSPPSLNFPASGGEQTFTLTISGVLSWYFETYSPYDNTPIGNWITVSPQSMPYPGSIWGNFTITVTAAANNTSSKRTAKVWVYLRWLSYGGSMPYESVTVTQDGP